MKYKIQISVYNGYGEDRDIYCTCGHHRKAPSNTVPGACPKCGTEEIKGASLDYEGIYTYIDNMFEVVEKTDQQFHIKRQEFKVTFNRNAGTINVVPKNVGELKFSLRDKIIHISRNGKKITPTDSNVNTFFKGASKERVLKAISTDKTRNLFDFCYEHLSCFGFERTRMWGRGLTRLKEYPAVEMFGLSPLSGMLWSLWSHFRSVCKHSEPAPPHKILKVPKFVIPYLAKMNNLSQYTLEKIRALCDFFDGNSVKLLLQIFEDEANIDYAYKTAEYLIELHRDYGYTNLKKTVLYLTREVKLEQGISSPVEAATLLRDYVRMSQAMDAKYDKYTKSLKKDHDIALMNYKTRESEYKQKEFYKVVNFEDYSSLDFKGRELSIVRPLHVKDVIKEGESLSHCVASYVDDIIKRKCKILFMRKNENLDESLVTIEVRGGVVRQVRGKFNRRPTEEENNFVKEWAKTKNLELRYYY